MLGKIKTVTQIISISLLLLDSYILNAQDVFMVEKFKNVVNGLVQAPTVSGVISFLSATMVVVVLFTTLYSCYDYIVKNIDVLKSDK
jgi:phosphatidylglycerophosphate synthase